MESWKSEEEEEEDNQRRHSHFRKSLFFTRNGQRERQNSSAKKGFFGVNKGSHCPIHSSHHGRRLERILHLRLFLRGIEDDVRGRLRFIASRLRHALFLRPDMWHRKCDKNIRPTAPGSLAGMPFLHAKRSDQFANSSFKPKLAAAAYSKHFSPFYLLATFSPPFLPPPFIFVQHTREEEEEARPRREGGRKKRTNIIVFERGKGKKCRNYTGKGREGRRGKLGRGNR